jgi:hypothetical protein
VPTEKTNTTDPKESTATCTGGRKVIGGGYVVEGTGLGEVNVYENRPTSDTTWSVKATEDNDNPSYAIQAYAICANVGL